MPADQPPLPEPRDTRRPYRICLVCLGNICRSPTAEVVLRAELDRAGLAGLAEAESAGTGDWHLGQRMHPKAAAELARRGLDGSRHRARKFVLPWFENFDLILAMDSGNLADLRAMAPDPDSAARVALLRAFDPAPAGRGEPGDPRDLEVPDPYDGGPEDFALVFDLVRPAARGLAERLARRLNGDGRG